MSRKIDIESINLKVDGVELFELDGEKGIVIEWNADIGFGEYAFIKRESSGLWTADSEGMDNDDDKAFGKKLLELWMEKALIVG